MSTQPSPPSTYLLKQLHDVGLPEQVSWWPQTIGWKILAWIGLILLLVWLYKQAKYWWSNRYRREALQAAHTLDIHDPRFEYQVFVVIKRVMGYLNSSEKALYGEAFIHAFDAYLPGEARCMDGELAKKWMMSLNTKRQTLNAEEKHRLHQHCLFWLKQHQQGART